MVLVQGKEEWKKDAELMISGVFCVGEKLIL